MAEKKSTKKRPQIKYTDQDLMEVWARETGGLFGKARKGIKGRQAQAANPEMLEQEREANYEKVMKKYKSRAR